MIEKKYIFGVYFFVVLLVIFSFFCANIGLLVGDLYFALNFLYKYVYKDKRLRELFGVFGLIATAVFNLNLFLLIVSCLLVLYVAGFITNVFFKKHVNYKQGLNCKGKFLLDLFLDNVCAFCFYIVYVNSFVECLLLTLLLTVGFAALVLFAPVALQPLACALIVASFVFVILLFVGFFIKNLFQHNADDRYIVYPLCVVLLACAVCSVVFLPTLVLNLLMHLNFLVELVSITLPLSFYLFACFAFGVSILVNNAFWLYFKLRKKEEVGFDVTQPISLDFLKSSCENKLGYQFAIFNSNFIKYFVCCLFGLNFFGLGLIYNFLISALVANRLAYVCLFSIHAILQDVAIIMTILLLSLKFSLGLAPIIALFCLYVLLDLGVSSVVSSVKLNICSLIFVCGYFLYLLVFSCVEILLDIIVTSIYAIAFLIDSLSQAYFPYFHIHVLGNVDNIWKPVLINQKLAACVSDKKVLDSLDKAVIYMETLFDEVVSDDKSVANISKS